MTCINCPIEITAVHTYLDGVHVYVIYRDFGHSFYFTWRSAGKTNFYTMFRLISRVAQTVQAADQRRRMIFEAQV